MMYPIKYDHGKFAGFVQPSMSVGAGCSAAHQESYRNDLKRCVARQREAADAVQSNREHHKATMLLLRRLEEHGDHDIAAVFRGLDGPTTQVEFAAKGAKK